MRYILPVLLAVALLGVAVGRSHPAGQACAEAEALREAGGTSSTAVLTKQATKDFTGLLKGSAPACAINGLAEGRSTVASRHNVPASVSGVSWWRAYLGNLGLDTTDWVLVAISALLLARTAFAFFVSRRPGAVNLGSVIDADSKDPSDRAIAAQIHGRLAAHKLFGAPLLPGGGLPEAVATTLKETELPNAKWLSALVRALPDLVPKSGVTIDAVMRKRDSGPAAHGCTVTLTDIATGRILAVETEWQATPLEAADAAAVYTIAHILQRDAIRRRTPAWSRFAVRTKQALAEFTQGQDAEAKDIKAAREHYHRALATDPANLAIALKLGNAQTVVAVDTSEQEQEQERARLLAASLLTYLRASELWPDALSPRYRAAVALTACADRDTALPKHPDLKTEKQRRDASRELLQGLVDDMRWRKVTAKWLETFYRPEKRAYGTRKYFQRLVNPVNLMRSRARATYEMSLLVADGSADQEKRVKQLLCEADARSFTPFKRLALNWQVRYNAACFYSRLAGNSQGTVRKTHLARANKLLQEVLSDPRHQITGSWLSSDPDLEQVRKWKGGDWQHVNVIEKVTKPTAKKAAKPAVVAARKAAKAFRRKQTAKPRGARKAAKAPVAGTAAKP